MMGLSEEAAEHVKVLRDSGPSPFAPDAVAKAIEALIGMLPAESANDEDWRWFDVGTMTRDEMRALGQAAAAHCGPGGSVSVDYAPGDSTLYLVVFTSLTTRLRREASADEGLVVVEHLPPVALVSIPNHGTSYELGDGWVHWTYVQEHWGLSKRSAMAVANLLNAYQGEL